MSDDQYRKCGKILKERVPHLSPEIKQLWQRLYDTPALMRDIPRASDTSFTGRVAESKTRKPWKGA
jgi:hypothetical protein